MDTLLTRELWTALAVPMARVLVGLCAGLFVATLIEGMQWSRPLARLAAPLVRLAHLGETSGTAFALAMFSPSSANALLGEARRRGDISEREVILSNLFNSLPSWVTHTPTIFFLTWPVLGFPAVIYTGLTLVSAMARTLLTVLLGRALLPAPSRLFPDPSSGTPPNAAGVPAGMDREAHPWRAGLRNAWKRFRRRLPRLILVAAPIYASMFFLQKAGFFTAVEGWLSAHVDLLSFLRPEALGIIVLYMAAELGAAVAAAGSTLQASGLPAPEVVMALLIGNILSTPMRAVRHQLPAYAAYFPPSLAARLVIANQAMRAGSIAVVACLYGWAAL